MLLLLPPSHFECSMRWWPWGRDSVWNGATRGVMVNTPAVLACHQCGFESCLGLEFSSLCGGWHLLKLVVRGFLRVLRFPPHLHRLLVSANEIKLE